MKRRMTVKRVDRGWRVYDTAFGSFPYRRKGIGEVAQDHPTEADAWQEADRLEAILTDQGRRAPSSPRESAADDQSTRDGALT